MVRRASPADAAAIAAVFSPSLRLMTFLPELHSVQEDQWYIEHFIMRECNVTVVVWDCRIVSFLARDAEHIRLLHTHPDCVGRGAGSMLVEHAKASDVNWLEIWCFEANLAARRFYERHGFRPVAATDGARNEEKLPDMLYRWEPCVG